MAQLTVAMVYGEALFEAASDAGERTDFLEETKELSRLFAENAELAQLLSTPVIPAQRRKAAMKEIFEGRIRQELLNLLYVLIDKGRGSAFQEILRQFEHLVEKSERRVEGRIVSAAPLTEEQKSRFEEQTGKLLQKQVRLNGEVDPKVLGGVRIFIEGKVLDATVQTRLSELNERLMSAVI